MTATLSCLPQYRRVGMSASIIRWPLSEGAGLAAGKIVAMVEPTSYPDAIGTSRRFDRLAATGVAPTWRTVLSVLVMWGCVSTGWAACSDPPGAGVDWTACEKPLLVLRGVNLAGARLAGADLHGTDFQRANLSGADLTHASVDRARFSGADLSRAKLAQLNAYRANMAGAILVGVDMTKAEMARANLASTDLSRANLRKAELQRTNLEGSKLDGANLTGADLARTNFSKTSLAGTRMTQARTYRTRFEGVDLGPVVGLTQSQLDSSCGDAATRLPAGLEQPKSWPCGKDD